MAQEKISIFSTLVNFCLASLKLFFGLAIGSIALIADGIHSGLDVFSSFVSFLGIRMARKPVDEKHPYGHYRMESLAGLLITVLLMLSAFWIIYEAFLKIFEREIVTFSFLAIVVMVISMVVNELMARWKFLYGRKYQSLSLIADAQHSRADVLSSFGVLLALSLTKYFYFADSVIAFLIGCFIIFSSFKIGKEITDSLLDVSNKNIEERIKKICFAHEIEISQLKTRRIGAVNFAEIKIKLNPKLRVDEVSELTKALEERLLQNIKELKHIVISIESHQMSKTTIIPDLGRKICTVSGFEQIGPKKLGERIIISLDENNQLSDSFGADKYLVVDTKDNKILAREIVKNPYFEKDSPHGARFTKAVLADKVITKNIGPNAKNNLESFDIEVEIVPANKELENILEEIKQSKTND